MGRKTDMITVELTLREAVTLAQHLVSLTAKGTISTIPGWAKRIVSKLHRAAQEQYPKTAAQGEKDNV